MNWNLLLARVFVGLFLACQCPVFGQIPTFQKTYGGLLSEGAECVIEADNGDFLIAGAVAVADTNHDALLMRVDKNGHLLWQKNYGTSAQEGFSRVLRGNDGGFIALGHTYGTLSGLPDVWLVKVDDEGAVIWQKTIGQSNRKDTPDGEIVAMHDGYVFAGEQSNAQGAGRSSFFVRVDNLGNIRWAHSNRMEFARAPNYRVQYVLNDSIYFCGGHIAPAHWMIRDTATGEANLFQTFEGGNTECLHGMRPSPTGGMVMCGRVFPQAPGSPQRSLAWLQYSPIGEPIRWSKTYAVPGWIEHYALLESAAGGGYLVSLVEYPGQGVLMKIDAQGDVVWAKSYSSRPYHGFSKPVQTADGGIVAVGYSYDATNNGDVLLLKTDANGNIAGCCTENRAIEVTDHAVPALPNAFMSGEQYGGIAQIEQIASAELAYALKDVCENPAPTLRDTIQFCPGETVALGGATYDQPGTVVLTIPSATGDCDTLATYALELLPQPSTLDSIFFAPGDTVFLGGTAYTQPGLALDTLPTLAGGCDTLAFYVLAFKTSGAPALSAHLGALKISPNPATPAARLRVAGARFERADWALHDLTGRAVASGQMFENQLVLPKNGLPASVYLLKIYANGQLAASGRLLVKG